MNQIKIFYVDKRLSHSSSPRPYPASLGLSQCYVDFRQEWPKAHLVSCSNVLLFTTLIDALSDVRALLLQRHEYTACLVVKS